MKQYFILMPDVSSQTAWESELRESLPKQMFADEIEMLTINLLALKDKISRKSVADENDFSVTRACEILDIKKSALHEWIKRGFVVPSIRSKEGRGKAMVFNRKDLYRIALFQIINARGLIRTAATVLVKYLSFKDTVLD